jgi:aryl-alcohol dehydrogenase-like predicted oxidoreductase
MESPIFVPLGNSGLKINPIGLGVMGMSAFYGNRPTEENAIKVIHRALELGVNFFDTAYVYAWGINEVLLGKAIKSAIAAGQIKREDVVIATKFGLVKQGDTMVISSSPDDIRTVVDGSLQRLDLGPIDLLYQHRVDPKTPIEDVIHVMAEYVKQGKVKALGLSEPSVETLRKAHAVHPISALQTEYSLWSTEPESGLLDVCRELGITFVAYSPLGRGFLTGAIKKPEDLEEKDWRCTNPRFVGEAFTKNLELVKAIQDLAKQKICTPGQLALAWVLRKPNVVAIPGTTKIDNLEDNMGALKVKLTDEDNAVIKKILDQIPVEGDRYAPAQMKAVNL